METVLYFIVIAGFFFLMMRFGCGAHVMGHAGNAGAGNAQLLSEDTAIDPVCGMTVTTKTAKPSIYRGTAYYFCSTVHRETFEAGPERYAGSTGTTPTGPIERAS